MLSINVVPEFQRWGLGLVLMKYLAPKALEWGVQDAEFSWISEDKGQYEVVDPTFEGTLWLDGQTIKEESSGEYLVPRSRLPKGARIEIEVIAQL